MNFVNNKSLFATLREVAFKRLLVNFEYYFIGVLIK